MSAPVPCSSPSKPSTPSSSPSSRTRQTVLGVPMVLAGVVAALLVAAGAAAVVGVVGVGPLAGRSGGTPDNDSFSTAAVAVDQRFVGTTTGAGVSQLEIDAGVAAAGERVVWFTWVPDHHGWAYVTPTLGDDEQPQPEVRVFEGPGPDEFDRVDAPGAEPGSASVPAVADRTYSVAVVGTDAVGAFDLSAFQPDGGTRPNDEPASAVVLGRAVLDAVDAGDATVESAVDTLGGATAAVGEPGVGGDPARHSVWYAWDVPLGGGSVTVTVEPLVAGTGTFRLGSWEAADATVQVVEDVAELTLLAGGGTTLVLDGAEGARRYLSVDGPEDWYRLEVRPDGVAAEDRDPPVVSCDEPPTGWSPGEVVLACTATDDGVGLADPDGDASFDLVADVAEGVEVPDATTDARTICDRAGNCTQVEPIGPIAIDRRPPEVRCDTAPQGWLDEDPGIVCIAVDDGSGLADPDDAERTRTGDVAEGEARVAVIDVPPVCDAVGNCSEPGDPREVQVDRAPPVVDCEPGPTGVQTDEVVIACTTTDEGSGLADPSLDVGFEVRTDVGTATAELEAFTDEREVCDVAGNCVTAGPFGPFAIDRAAPAVVCDVPDGWQTGIVTVPCAVSDDGVGLADDSPDTVVLTAGLPDGEQSAAVATDEREVCDLAGNCTTVGPFQVRIDNRPPEVTCGKAPATWVDASPVLIDCGVSDAGSGLADGVDDPLGAGGGLVRLRAEMAAGDEGEVSTHVVEVCDQVGNCTPAGPVDGVRIDRRLPEVTCVVPSGPVRTEARVRCTAADDGSGLRAEADEEFVLTTSVGAGNADPVARTGRREVCDRAGNCRAVGPFTIAVDRTDPGDGDPLEVAVPNRVTVLAAVDPAGPVPAPYEVPTADGVVVVCLPAPGTVLGEGWTAVSCDAEADDGRRGTLAFPLVVKPVPSLAPGGTATAGGAWRAAGIGFAPASAVDLELDGQRVRSVGAADDGRVEVAFTWPDATPPGERLVVLRGIDPNGAPLLVVAPTAVEALEPGQEPPSEPPAGAPALPAIGPDVPPDPGPPPVVPDFDRAEPPSTPPTTEPPTFPLPTLPGDPPPGPDDPGPDDPGPGDPDPSDPGPGGPGSPGDGGTGGDIAGGPGGDGAGGPVGAAGQLPRPLGAATLPVTGVAVGALVVWGLLLVLGGGSLHAGARRLRRHRRR